MRNYFFNGSITPGMIGNQGKEMTDEDQEALMTELNRIISYDDEEDALIMDEEI